MMPRLEPEVFGRRAAPGRSASGLVDEAVTSRFAALVVACCRDDAPRACLPCPPARRDKEVRHQGDAAGRPGAAVGRRPSGFVRPLVPEWRRSGCLRPLRRRPAPRSGRSIRKVTPEEKPVFQPWALAKIKAMTPTELELSKSSVNCLPRGVPAIWLQNPYTTLMVHKPGLLVQLYEVLNNWRVIHLDGRPLPEDPEPFFHGNSAAALGGRHAGGRIDRVRRPDVHRAERVVSQRRITRHRAL